MNDDTCLRRGTWLKKATRSGYSNVPWLRFSTWGVAVATAFLGCGDDPTPVTPTDLATFEGEVVLEFPGSDDARVLFEGRELGKGNRVKVKLELARGADRLLLAHSDGRVWGTWLSYQGGQVYSATRSNKTLRVTTHSTAAMLVHLSPAYFSVSSEVNAVVEQGLATSSALDELAGWFESNPSAILGSGETEGDLLLQSAVSDSQASVQELFSQLNDGTSDQTQGALSSPAELHRAGAWGENYAGPVTVSWKEVDGKSAGLEYQIGTPFEWWPAWLTPSLLSLDYVVTFERIDKRSFVQSLHLNDKGELNMSDDRHWPVVAGSQSLAMFKPTPIFEWINLVKKLSEKLAKDGVNDLADIADLDDASLPTVPLDRYGSYIVRFYSGALLEPASQNDRWQFLLQDEETTLLWRRAQLYNMLRLALKLASTIGTKFDEDKLVDLVAKDLVDLLNSPEFQPKELAAPGQYEQLVKKVVEKVLAAFAVQTNSSALSAFTSEAMEKALGKASQLVSGLTSVGIGSQLLTMPTHHSFVLTVGEWRDCETDDDCTFDAFCQDGVCRNYDCSQTPELCYPNDCGINPSVCDDQDPCTQDDCTGGECTHVKDTTIPGCAVACRVVDVVANSYHTCALTEAGTLWCWGSNNKGQIGDGTMADKNKPTPLTTLGSSVAEVAVGYYHSCARKVNGELWCWGENLQGQVTTGVNSEVPKTIPTPIPTLGSAPRDIATGHYHTCAVLVDGGVWCWGGNYSGELGDETTLNQTALVQVSSIGSSAERIWAGEQFTCSQLKDGTIWCWGFNGYGNLGDGTTQDKSTPVQITALGTDVADMSLGYGTSCALKQDGTVWCWGTNYYHQLGDGTTVDQSTPKQLTTLGPTVAQVSVAGRHVCARKLDGTLWCWGYNQFGQLGNTTTIDEALPVQVASLGPSILQVTTGQDHTCALTTGGNLYCWGYNNGGAVGDGTNIHRSLPMPVVIGGDGKGCTN